LTFVAAVYVQTFGFTYFVYLSIYLVLLSQHSTTRMS